MHFIPTIYIESALVKMLVVVVVLVLTAVLNSHYSPLTIYIVLVSIYNKLSVRASKKVLQIYTERTHEWNELCNKIFKTSVLLWHFIEIYKQFRQTTTTHTKV